MSSAKHCINYLLAASRRLMLRLVWIYIMRKMTNIQAQINVGIANHGVIATVIIVIMIKANPIIIMSNMHIANIKSTIFMSLANLIHENVSAFKVKLLFTGFIGKCSKIKFGILSTRIE